MDTLPDILSSFEYAACGLVTTEVNGTIRRVNTTFCKWLDFNADELVDAKKIQELFTVGGRFFHHTHWAPLLQLQGSVSEIQMDLVCRNGKTLPMLINVVRKKHGDLSFDQLAFFVATDRKNYERELLSTRKTAQDSLASLHEVQRELQKNRDFLSVAISSARMGIWSEDLHTHHVWLSPELEKLAGIGSEKFNNTHEAFLNLIHKDDQALFAGEVERAVREKADYNVEFRLQHAEGFWLAMEARGHATYSDSGEAVSIVGVVIDVSDSKATEEKLRELNQQLSINDRRKDEFLATLAHELRNPLAPMRNVLEIMRFKESTDPFMRWSRDLIERHVSQMTHLVDDLMETSRISQGRVELRKQQINIADAIQHAIETSHALMEKSKHNFIVNKPEVPIIIDADSTRIVQIISNLLTNAAKYTPDGGSISLSAVQHGDEAVISVRDSGIGIPREQLSNVFNMFSQLKPALERSQGGLGIGLALVRGLVELHGGTISAHSEGDGKGSEFIVRLPIAKLETNKQFAGETQNQNDVEYASSIDGLRILVVDDNVDAAESLALLLEIGGHNIRIAHDGMTGLAAAEEFRPDVVLLDIGLPDINGYEVARSIRQQLWGKEMNLIAATGWGQDKDKELAHNSGFNNHLTKPIDFQKLNALLQKT